MVRKDKAAGPGGVNRQPAWYHLRLRRQRPRPPPDPAVQFAVRVRDHKELESRWAVLQEARVEYFRSRDLLALLRKHPDLAPRPPPPSDSAPPPPPLSPEEAGELLLHRKLVYRCDRVVKVIRPGKKKLSKWPARLEVHPDQSFAEDGFYAWTFERKRPAWQYVLSFLVPVVTVACCLFPVAPHWCKLAVLYFCITLLCLIFGVLLRESPYLNPSFLLLLTIRVVVFALCWIVAGKRVWFFPNILAEEALLSELFRFWPEAAKDEEPPPKLASRLALAACASAAVYLCVQNAPDEQARTRYRKKFGNAIDEMLLWSPAMLSKGNSSSDEPPVSATAPPPPAAPKAGGFEGDSKESPLQEEAAGSESGGDNDIDELSTTHSSAKSDPKLDMEL
eukprot:SM000040S14764  [mRNA]  locus=s40:208292:210982:+ [translate_table: standard]